MTHPHIIDVGQLVGFRQPIVLASDTRRSKRLVAEFSIQASDNFNTRLVVYDFREPEGRQIVKITWDLQDAVNTYNELG